MDMTRRGFLKLMAGAAAGMVAPRVPAIQNNLIAGISGAGWTSVDYAALDDRFNDFVVSVRGTIADRRLISGARDFDYGSDIVRAPARHLPPLTIW